MSKRTIRKTIAKTNTFWRVTPMEVNESRENDSKGSLRVAALADHPDVQIIDTPFENCTVVMAPPTLSYAMARSIEQRVMDVTGVPCIVMSSNLVLCRVEGPLNPSEVEDALKEVQNVDHKALADALVRQAATANAAEAEAAGGDVQADEGSDKGGEEAEAEEDPDPLEVN